MAVAVRNLHSGGPPSSRHQLLGCRTVANNAGVDAPSPFAGSDSFRDKNSGRVGNVLNAPDRKASVWQFSGMHKTTVSRRMSLKLLDSLYVEAIDRKSVV